MGLKGTSIPNAGAKDVYLTPIVMKKSRPAITLSVLCNLDAEQNIEQVLFKETSTIGLRKQLFEKLMLDRKMDTIGTPYGEVRIKTAYYNGRKLKSKPEYEDCLKIAQKEQISLNDVYTLVQKSLLEQQHD